MTKELIERLRNGYQGITLGADGMGWGFDLDTLNEAADAIEALQARVAELKEARALLRAASVADLQIHQGLRAERDALAAEIAAAKEQKPMAYLRFWAAQRVTQDGGVDADEGLEVCRVQDIGADKQPAFPVFAAPVPPVLEPDDSDLLAALMHIRAGLVDAKNTNIVDYIDAVICTAQQSTPPVQETLSEQQVDYEKAADWLAGHAQGLTDGKALSTCKKCKEPISEIADCNSATCPTMQDFNSWWYASKYMQVVNASSGTRQAAIDGWNAAIEAAHGIKEQK